MNSATSNFIRCLLLIGLCVLVHISSSAVFIMLALAIAYVMAFLSVYRMTESIGNYLTLFIIFHLLYGALGPLSVLLGQDLPRVFAGTPPATVSFLRQVLLSLTAFLCAVTFVRSVYSYQPRFRPRLEIRAMTISTASIVLAALSSAMYITNVLRLGGVAAVLLGKATFQSNLGSLQLTLPYQIVADVAVALFAIAYVAPKDPVNRWRFLSFLVCLGPVLASYALLGQRGPLVGWLLIYCTAAGLYRRYRVRVGHVIWGIVAYVGLSVLFVLRGATPYIAKTGDFAGGLHTAFRNENLVYALNPGTNEFGGVFGNFSAFEQEKRIAYPLLGRSYVEAMAVPIPGFMYPGEKPKQIAYIFRDAYIPDFGRVTRISGTGLGSLLEAYINFGPLGCVIVYGIWGFFVALVEFSKNRFGTYGVLNYVTLSQLMQSFHRSSFGLIYGTVVLVVILTASCWFAIQLASSSRRSRAFAGRESFDQILRSDLWDVRA